jgi:purine-binding chemotaxis protein CheW
VQPEYPGQVLSFVLGRENYGVDILRVQEIRGWVAVTQIPNSPPDILGVINLRGDIVPIIDLRKKFALECVEYKSITVVIILAVRVRATSRQFGIVVDGVSDVIDIDPASVKPTPDLGSPEATRHIRGLVTMQERMLSLLDMDELIPTTTGRALP